MSGGNDKSFTRSNIQKPGDPELVADIRRMIEETRATVAATVNARRNYSGMLIGLPTAILCFLASKSSIWSDLLEHIKLYFIYNKKNSRGGR